MIERLEQPLIVYVCGKRSGMPNEGFDAIEGCAQALRMKGLQVISPIFVNINMLGAEYSPQHDRRYRAAYPGLRADIFAILSVCNAIALMPGWETAVGCRIEVAVAISFRYQFVDWQTGEPIARPASVTIDHGYGEPNPMAMFPADPPGVEVSKR